MLDSHKQYDRFNVDWEKLAGLIAGCLIMACTVFGTRHMVKLW